MPRNGSGVYSTPAGTTPTNGDDIDAVPFNLLISDISADLNAPRPIASGGTGASSAATARTAFDVAQKQASVTDATEGRAMLVGAFGLGGIGAVAPANISVAPGVIAPGVYSFSSSVSSGGPSGVTNGTLTQTQREGAVATQTLIVDSNTAVQGQMWWRVYVTGAWQAWRRAVTSDVLAADVAATVILDEDNFATNSATRPPSQQSTKAYVDGADAAVALAAGLGFGPGASWQDMTGSRVTGTTYQNTGARPIMVSIMGNFNVGGSTSGELQESVNGTSFVSVEAIRGQQLGSAQAIIMPTRYYRFSGANAWIAWKELRA